MDVFLLIFVVAIIGIAIAVNIHLLFYYEEELDRRAAKNIILKVIIVTSLTLTWVVVLLLPVDVRNSRPTPGPLDMQALWKAAFITLAVFLAIIVPSAMLYSEVEGDDLVKKKGRYVACYLMAVLFVCGALVAITYPFLSFADIPVTQYECSSWQDIDAVDDVICDSGVSSSLSLSVGIDVYIIAVLCFVGWFFFVVFGGIGLSAVPIDLILEFIDRPTAIDEKTYQERRRILGQAAQKLLEQANGLQERDGKVAYKTGWRGARQKRTVKVDYNKWRRDVNLLEDEFERLKVSKFHKGENPVVSFGKLAGGILLAIVSLLWVLQILISVISRQIDPNAAVPFLDAIFMACEGAGAYPVGVALFAVFTLYLCICVVKGCFKFGMRIAFLFTIHPMRHKATPLNSILFNVEMLLISTGAVVQFAQTAFGDYARLTDADIIFSAQIKYMTFYRWFFENNVFIYTLLAWFVLCLLYLLCKPRDSASVQLNNKKADKWLAKLVGKPADPPADSTCTNA
jgi:LMBR1 domain-containing protein 1